MAAMMDLHEGLSYAAMGIFLLHMVYNLILAVIYAASKKKGRKIPWDSKGLILVLMFVLLMVTTIVSASQAYDLICAGILLMDILCVILQWKICTGDKIMDHITCGIKRVRRKLLPISDRLLPNGWLWLGIIFVAGGLISCVWSCALCITVIILFLVGTLLGMRSCRHLLASWLMIAGAAAVAVSMGMEQINTDLLTRNFLYLILYTFACALLWCISIGLADHEAGRLAALVVNTLTTVALIILNVLAAYGLALPEDMVFLVSKAQWSMIQAGGLYGLLPYVAAGYIAALFKECQIYWEKKHMSHREKNRG